METQDFKNQILKCISFDTEFRSTAKRISQEIANQHEKTTQIFLDTVSDVICNNKDALTRFYALNLLKVVTKQNNPRLLQALFAHPQLLKTLEQQAAYDKDKKFPKRGSTFFNSKPSPIEKAIGNNYLALLLEMIKYWDEKHDATDQEGRGNIPQALYKRLSKEQNVQFPEHFSYYKQQDRTHAKKAAETTDQDFKSQLLKCLYSEDEFKRHYKQIRQEIANQNEETMQTLLAIVSDFISNKTKEPDSRFFALFLLKVVTEHSNPPLLKDLFAHTELLKTLEEQAAFDKDNKFPWRGSTLFHKDPSEGEQTLGSNYMVLLLEMIKYWDETYGATDQGGKDNTPRALYKRLSKEQNIPFLKGHVFYKHEDPTQATKAAGTNRGFRSQILKCVSSENEFKNIYKLILHEIANQNEETIQTLLATVSDVISHSKEADSRYFALYLLKVVTDHSNIRLLQDLFDHTELMKALEEQAVFNKYKPIAERGANFFSSAPSPSEKSLGSNYIVLLLEMIKYWDETYGASDQEGKNNTPRALYKRLLKEQHVSFPEHSLFYKQKPSTQTNKAEQKGSETTEHTDAEKPIHDGPHVKVETTHLPSISSDND